MKARKKTALILTGIYVLVEWVIKPLWNINVERAAEAGEIDKALLGTVPILTWLLDILPRSFPAGFVIGALLFAYWDSIRDFISRRLGRQAPEAPHETVFPEAKGEPEIIAWVAAVDFDLVRSDHATITIKCVNLGDVPFRLGPIRGCLRLTYQVGQVGPRNVVLPTPTILRDPSAENPIDRGYVASFVLSQPLPNTVIGEIPEMFGRRPFPSLDFEGLRVTLCGDGVENEILEIRRTAQLSTGRDQIRVVEASKAAA
jgi:hypothetical protein